MKKDLVYKTVALIKQSDTTFIKKSSQVIKVNEYTLLTKHFKKNVFFLFVKSANYIPFADFNILIYKNLTDLQENLTNNLILLLENRNELREIKKIIKNHSIKLVYLDNFINELLNLKENRVSINHPSFIAENWIINDGQLSVECFLKEGLVSKKVVCNNTILEIEEIISDKVYKPEEVFRENEELDYEFITEINEIISDVQKEEILFEEEEISLENEENQFNTEERSTDFCYKDYLNINDLNNPTLERVSVNDLFIPKNTKAFTNRVIKRNKVFFKNENVTIKFRKENNFKFLPLFINLFDVEGKLTVFNLNFTSKNEIKKEEFLLENDIFNFKIIPVLTKDKGYKIHIEENSLKSGVFTFIGPLFLCDKFKIREKEISCTLLDYSYRLIVQEKVKIGVPIKIYKKTVIVKNMFNSPEEVMKYKDYKLRTESGTEGMIKGSLGSKGIFKAYFFRPVQGGEKIRLSMFKQVFLE